MDSGERRRVDDANSPLNPLELRRLLIRQSMAPGCLPLLLSSAASKPADTVRNLSGVLLRLVERSGRVSRRYDSPSAVGSSARTSARLPVRARSLPDGPRRKDVSALLMIRCWSGRVADGSRGGWAK